MTYEKLSSLSDEALVHRELQLERDLIAATFRHKTGQLENTNSITVLRKDIARARTAQRQRELAQGLGRNGLRGLHSASFRAGSAVEASATGSSGFLKGLAGKFGLGSSDDDSTEQSAG